MRKTNKSMGSILGASVEFPVEVGHAPWDFYHLLDSLKDRLRPARGKGRPTDEEWTIRRLVGFKEATWKKLRKLADEADKRGGPRLSPAQIAAFLIEKTINHARVG